MGGSSKKRSASMVEDSDGPEESVAPSIKKTKNAAAAAQPSGKDDDGNPYWEVWCQLILVCPTSLTFGQLTNNRRVGVSKFKNMALINVREYYEKDGKMLPGKKVRSHDCFLSSLQNADSGRAYLYLSSSIG